MSLLGSYKARITKAAKALREKISEVDEAILQPLDPVLEAKPDIASADTLPPRASSATQGFGVSPNHPLTFGNPFMTSSCPSPNPFAVSSTPPNPTSSQSSVEQSLKLPSFEISTFHGDIDRFYEFWDLFSTALHNNTSVPVPVKFTYMKSHSRGPAANIIAGFQSTAENYDEA
ncbi:unnamed protein product [Cylicocyclus nassatus]|uniref:Uncharacterized protein n=1 Tax=Cylicocyclus nassatus TaxID=53992 RepID=A0AA36GIA3_CYLNA|nr:unnamed protein product [Cylicocyclus nassatus]